MLNKYDRFLFNQLIIHSLIFESKSAKNVIILFIFTFQMSKRTYFDSLREKNLMRRFEELFPRGGLKKSLNQFLCFDLKAYMSTKTETLTLECDFAGPLASPANRHVLLFSIHPSGEATCRSGGPHRDWIWEFKEKEYSIVHSY